MWLNELKWHGEEREGNAQFPNAAYIGQLTDEYRCARNGSPMPHIFIG
jgi:hypothetical protein